MFPPRERHRVPLFRADVPEGIDIVHERAERPVAGCGDRSRSQPAPSHSGTVPPPSTKTMVAPGGARPDRSAHGAEHVASHEVDCAAGGLARHGGEEVVAEREMLEGIIPERGHRIAIEVAEIGIEVAMLVDMAELARLARPRVAGTPRTCSSDRRCGLSASAV